MLEDRNLLACDAMVCVDVQFVDPAAPTVALGTLEPGQDYEAQVFIQDDRDSPSGIFQAYFDVGYNPSLISIPVDEVDHGPQYQLRTLGDSSVAGNIDAAGGGSNGIPSPPGDSYLLFSFPFQADAVGSLTLSIAPDNLSINQVEFFVPGGPVQDIAIAGNTIEIEAPSSPIVSIAATSNGAEAGPTNGVFTVSQAVTTTVDTVIAYTVSGTASSGDDYTALSGSVTIPANSSSTTINVPVIDDTVVEELETVIVTLDSITSGDAAVTIDSNNNVASLNITDNNDTATISIAPTAMGNETGPLNGQFTVTQTAPSGTPTTLSYSVIGGTATSGIDYTALSGTVTISPGQTEGSINVFTLDDDLIEGTETLIVRVDSITSGDPQISLGSPLEATVEIADNDASAISITSDSDGGEEGIAPGRFTVDQGIASTTDTVVSYTVTGTATSGSDFTPLSGSVTIPAGSTSATITVTPIDDAVVEDVETVVVTLDTVTAGNTPLVSIDSSANSASLNLADNDSASVSILGTTDGNEAGPTSGLFNVVLSAESSTETVVSYTVGGTATSGSDFTELSGSVVIPTGSTSATISVPVIDDSEDEGLESVMVTLDTITSGDSEITIDSVANSASINIIDNEMPRVSITATTAGQEQGAIDAVFTVSQTFATGTDTIVTYVVSGTATSGEDFTALPNTVTIPAGSTTATITAQVIDDLLVEGSESLTLEITNISGDPLLIIDASADEATASIADNDSATLSIAAATAGNEEGPISGQFTVTQNNASSTDTVVAYTVAGTATSGSDYTPLSGSITIPAGSTTATISVPTLDDSLVESTETVIVTLSSITSGNTAQINIDGAANSASISLLDNDSATLTIETTAGGNEAGPVNGQFLVSQSSVSATDTVVNYAVGGTATSGVDYTPLSGTVTIPAGSSIAVIDVPVIDDDEIEGVESVIVTLSAITSGDAEIMIGAMDEATVQISDDESPSVSIGAITDGAEQGPANGIFEVSQSIVTTSDTVVNYVVSGSATPGDDFTALPGSITIPMNATTATITASVIDDALVEGMESLTLTITSITGDPQLTINAASDEATISIADNDTATVNIVATAGGDEAGPINGVFTVNQTANSTVDTVINYSVTGTTTEGSDFSPLSGTVTIPAGSQSTPIVIATIDDALVEELESVIITLDSISSGNTDRISIDTASDTASINLADDDSATVSIEATTNGNETGPTNGQFTVTQSAISSTATVITYSVSGTATSGEDFTPLSGSVTIPAGSTTTTIDVPVLDDGAAEGTEGVTVTLDTITSGDSDITVGVGNQATVLISDDDVPRISISATTDGTEDGPFEGVITVFQSIATGSDTIVSYSVTGSATSDVDFTALSGSLTIPMGETSATICVPVIDDLLLEGTETVTLMITGFTGDPLLELDVANQSDTINIVDDETGLISIAGTVDGAENGPVNGVFTITQDGVTSVDTVISYTVSGTATESDDYASLSDTVTILAGQSTATVVIPVIEDGVVEPSENVTLRLDAIVSGNDLLAIDSTADTATVLIADDDTAMVSIEATSDGDEQGPTNGQFTVTQSNESSTDTVISYVVSGTATSGSDFTALSGSVTIPAGSTTATIDLNVLDDNIVEENETVQILLSVITSANDAVTIDSLNNSDTVTIVDNDAASITVVAGANASEEGENDGAFQVLQSNPSSSDTVVSYTVSGSATPGDDFATLSGTVTIPAGQTSATIIVDVVDDPRLEDTENVMVALTSITSGDTDVTIDPAADEASVDIVDNESGLIQIMNTSDGNEDGLVGGVFTVSQGGTTDTDTILTYSVSGTATSGDDYTAVPGTVTIAAGETSATIDIDVLQDQLIEGTEAVSITLTGISSGDGRLSIDAANDDAEINILDDDSGAVSIDGTNGGAEQGPIAGLFTLTQSGVANVDTVIAYTVTGTATSGDDFTPLSGVATITAGSTSATIDVQAIDDLIVEGDETVIVTLDTISNGNPLITIDPAANSDFINISDNDTALVSITGTSDGNESGPSNGTITVSQSAESSVDTVISLSVSGSASPGDDFTALGNVTIAAGTTTTTIDLAVIDDALVEGTESLTVMLGSIISGNSQVTIDAANDDGSLQILDNDMATIAFDDSTSTVLEFDGSHTVSVVLSVPGGGQLAQDVSVNVSVTGGTADTPEDFTLLTTSVSFSAGSQDGASQTVQLSLVDDQIMEEIETIVLGLVLPAGVPDAVSLGTTTSHTVSVSDDNMDAVISGRVWLDADNDGVQDVGELTIPGVTISLSGTTLSGDSVTRQTTSDEQGFYQFTDLFAGTYSLTETQPEDFIDGMESLGTVDGVPTGTVGDDQFTSIELDPSQVGSGYNFGEVGLQAVNVIRFRVLARPRHDVLLGPALTSTMIAAASQPDDSSNSQLTSSRQGEGERIVDLQQFVASPTLELDGSILRVNGTASEDVIRVAPAASTEETHLVEVNGQVNRYDADAIDSILVSESEGNDLLILDDTTGDDLLMVQRDRISLDAPTVEVEAIAVERVRAISNSGGDDDVIRDTELASLDYALQLEGDWKS